MGAVVFYILLALSQLEGVQAGGYWTLEDCQQGREALLGNPMTLAVSECVQITLSPPMTKS
jgi:hypothetical protein